MKMKSFVQRFAGGLAKDDAGLTLFELLIVVAILAALLAIIVPNLGSLSGRGKSGVAKIEQETVQNALDAMMTDENLNSVTARSGNSSQVWSALPTNTAGTPIPLTSYLKSATTTYYYCWDGGGDITRQDEVPTTC